MVRHRLGATRAFGVDYLVQYLTNVTVDAVATATALHPLLAAARRWKRHCPANMDEEDDITTVDALQVAW